MQTVSDNPFQAAAVAAIEQLEDSLEKRVTLSARLQTINREVDELRNLVIELSKKLPPDAAREINATLERVTSGKQRDVEEHPQSATSKIKELIACEPTHEWSQREIRERLAGAGLTPDPRVIHNALNYLRKTGHLVRVDRGRYRVSGYGFGFHGID